MGIVQGLIGMILDSIIYATLGECLAFGFAIGWIISLVVNGAIRY